jgi:hypothetical protein
VVDLKEQEEEDDYASVCTSGITGSFTNTSCGAKLRDNLNNKYFFSNCTFYSEFSSL